MKFDNSWTLFLDRDGVINEREKDGYVKKVDDFSFVPGSIKAIEKLSGIFGRIVVVTNQGAVNRGMMTVDDLNTIHRLMLEAIIEGGGKITKVYFCPHTPDENCNYPHRA